MAATVIDALLVTLGLDTSDFRKGQKDVSDDLKKQREDAKKTAKEMAEQGKKAAAFFGSIKTELLALTGVTVTAGGLMSLVKNTTSSLMDLSVQSKALGMSAKELDGWTKSAEAAGSSAEKITNVLKGFQDAKQGATFGVFTNPLYEVAPILRRLTGVEINASKDDVPTIARKVFSALQKVKNPAMRRVLAEKVGIDDATLQRNQEGNFLPDVDRLTKSSGITDASTKGAKEFTEAWAVLNQNLETTKNQFYTFLIPYIREFNRVLLDLSNWMKSNPKEMKAGIDAFFGAIKDVATAANDAADLVGGWKNAIELIIGATVGMKFLSFLNKFGKALLGLSLITLPKWLLVAAGLETSNRIDNLQEEAKREGKSVGQYLVDRKNQHQEGRGGFLGSADGVLNRVYSWWDNITDTGGATNVYDAYGTIRSSQPNSYQPNIPLNAQAAKLGKKGKAFLQAMTGEFGALEGKYGLPAGLLSSVAATESGGDPYAVSPKGAKGLFQFVSGTAKDMGLKGRDVFDPHKSAQAAARYLRQMLDETGGDLEAALMAYNGGGNRLKRVGKEGMPLESRQYAPKVMAGMRPGAGMAVDRAMPGQSGATYQFYGTKITTQAQNVEQLTSDIKKHGDNRVMLMAGYSGQ